MSAEAAGLALVLPDKMTLFLKRAAGHDHPLTWSLPGGMLEPKEPPEIGAIRETREETGWMAPEGTAAPTLIDGSGFYAIYRQRINSPFIPTLDHENIAYAWAPLDAPPEPLHPGLRDTIHLIAEDAAMPIATTPNAGMPAFAGARKRLQEAMDTADDMTPEGWRGLVNGLMEFFAEEAAEEEHQAQDAPFGSKIHMPRNLNITSRLERTERDAKEIKKNGLKSSGEQPREADGKFAGTGGRDESPEAAGKLTKRDKSEIGRVGSGHREEMPAAAFLMPSSRKYPVKEKQGDDWAYNRKLLLAAAREARMHGHEALAARADTIRKREFGGAEDADGVAVDSSHDGPWMSCMSKDGSTMYRNKNVPETAEIRGRTVQVDERLKAHETAEWKALRTLLETFEEENGREPNDDERKLIYTIAHHGAGVVAERDLVSAEDGDGGKAWNAWCRGQESKIEKGPFENEPDDADVKPFPHGHGDLETTVDCALDANTTMALDRESVRSFDRDGRMRVEVAHISRACVNPYRGKEIPGWQELGLDPNKVYNLLRDPEELRKAAPTFNGIQILGRHVPVSVEDHQAWDIIGTTGTDANFDKPFLDNSLYFWTKDSIEDIETERKKELSCGYHYRPDMTTTGEYEDEEGNRVHYDGVMREIVGNHLALVKDGRAGDDVVVGDSIEDMQWAVIERELLAMGMRS
jgi:8-oxo-dGTP pyrophosphatase MutT (NUDIX family)